MGVCCWIDKDTKGLNHQVINQTTSGSQELNKPKAIPKASRIKKQREVRKNEQRVSNSIMKWLRKEYTHNTNSLQTSIHSQVFVYWSQDKEKVLDKLLQVKPSFITNILVKIDENLNIRDLMKQSFPDLNSSVVFSKANNDTFMTCKMFALISKVSSSVNRKVVFKNLRLQTKEFWALIQMFSHVQERSFEDCKIKFIRRKFKLNPKCRFKIKVIGIIRSGLKHKTLSRIHKILKEQPSLSLCLSKVVVA